MAVAASIVVLLAGGCTLGSSATGPSPPAPFAPGSPWVGNLTPAVLPAPVNSLVGVDCVTASRCWAIGSTVGGGGAPNGSAVVASTDGGARWAAQVIPATVGYLSDITCSDRNRCTAVGQSQASSGQGAIIATADGGATWVQQVVPPGVLDVTAVSCRADHRCVAIGAVTGGDVALVSASMGAQWTQAGSLPPSVTGATGMSCPDDQHCWVTARVMADAAHVTGVIAVTTDGGTTWATQTVPPGTGFLAAVSCHSGLLAGRAGLPATGASGPGATAPGASGLGATTTTAPPETASTVAPVPGAAGVHCTVVGTTANGLGEVRTGNGLLLTSTDGGATWVARTVTPRSSSLMGVSCPAASECVAVGTTTASSAQAGIVLLTGRTAHPWRHPAVVSVPEPLAAVSCVSLAHCVAVGESVSERLTAG